MRTRAATLAVAAGLLLALQAAAPDAAAQQRNPLQTIGETVADRAHAGYRFERFTVSSADGSRSWRVNLGIPSGPPPATGWPSFWMLDGNGALIEFDDALLDELRSRPDPHLLVFIGYDNDLRIDSPARTRDYTFAADLRGTVDGDPHLVGGGANALLEVIERQIQPELLARASFHPQQRTLWGHSLAGLFVLHTLYTRTGLFQTYAAGSPSLWWANGDMQRAPEDYFIANNAGHPARVLLSLGGGERTRDVSNRDLSSARVNEHLRRITAAPPDAAATLAERLQAVPGLQVSYREFAGLTHGPMFRASLMDALHQVTGVADHSATARPGTAPGTPE